MERASRWWVFGSIWIRCCYRMLWWYKTAILPEDICLLGWLPREVCFNVFCLIYNLLTSLIRVHLSTIRSMGNCPCPRCLIPKDRAHQFGTKRDKKQRKSLARVDTLQYQVNVSSARKIIYQDNRMVQSKLVDDILKTKSLVPTEVCSSLCSTGYLIELVSLRMHFQKDYFAWDSTFSRFFWLILCMSSNLGSGKRCSLTCCEF